MFQEEANVLPIRHLVDNIAQHIFADLGTLMLNRMVKSFIEADEKLLPGAPGHPAVKTFARREQYGRKNCEAH
jgi:hypothetical protein